MTQRFKRLQPFLNEARHEGYFKLENSPFMPLCGEIISRNGTWGVLSLAHYYLQNGDLCADPEMEIEFDTEAETADALSITQAGLYYKTALLSTHAYPGASRDPVATRELNQFLEIWLGNLYAQGFVRLLKAPVVL